MLLRKSTFGRDKLIGGADYYFNNHVVASNFDGMTYEKKVNPYFTKYGFSFSEKEGEFYAAVNGIHSDLYIPIQLYYYHILPYLNNHAFMHAYTDKNMLTRLLQVAQNKVIFETPHSIVYCMNNKFYNSFNERISNEQAYDILLKTREDLIFKPTIETCNGDGVCLINPSQITKKQLLDILDNAGSNFVFQIKVDQHEVFSSFNRSSLNTLRIYTYGDSKGNYSVLCVIQRYGSQGTVKDNASSGGGFCCVNVATGDYDRIVKQYQSLDTTLLSNTVPQKVPYFEKIKDTVIELHKHLPYFDLLGWDISVTPQGIPVVIEVNILPAIELAQLANGPLFDKEKLDDIMGKVSKVKHRMEVKDVWYWSDKVGFEYKL